MAVSIVLSIGLLAASSAAVLIRLCDAPALVIAAYRLSISSVVLLPLGVIRHRREVTALSRQHGLAVLVSGLCLALHFALWITSLAHTSVANSALLVTTNPIFVGIGAWLIFKERVDSGLIAGTVVAFIGTLIVSAGGQGVGELALLGDALALAGAIAMSGHLLIGRRARATAPLLAYITPVNTLAALILVVACVVQDLPLAGYDSSTYVLFAAIALGPQLIGHSSFNYALRHVTPSVVALVLLAEPVFSTILAYFVLGEVPPGSIYLGGPIILSGIAIAVRPSRDG